MRGNSKVKIRSSFLLILVLSGVAHLDAGQVLTIAGTGKSGHSGDGGPAAQAQVGNPFGVEIGPDGALYVCEVDNHIVRRIDLSSGEISTVAGTGKKGYSGDGGLATEAKLNEPYEVRFDSHGDLYFVEMQNAVVRKVDLDTGLISTVAGTGKTGFSGDGGQAVQAEMNRPHSISFDGQDKLYICDIGNHRIRIVDLETGIIETFSGNGMKQPTPDGEHVAGLPLNGPRALDFDGKHSLYLALREGNALYRIDLKSMTIHHLAGNGQKGYSTSSPSKEAKLSGPKGVAVSPDGDVFFADTESHTIRVYRPATDRVETVVGDGMKGDGPDGAPNHCRLARPHGICLGDDGSIYIGDSENHRVRKWMKTELESTP
ncbi:Virginiamycin B lyase [Thalassoglobus neptunius]|uniref:Virginiamycin B lyase n=1 Tax=Thalassoglobus neptunius TaxID=1938619 RepID=A0A5C5X5E6_9PLAN|nr:hypothetical protein [Thalassoglobus neptunius]TWT57551.1 Virginiamycin B lyase [Thalassoglobus neptunius]